MKVFLFSLVGQVIYNFFPQTEKLDYGEESKLPRDRTGVASSCYNQQQVAVMAGVKVTKFIVKNLNNQESSL